jgi:signal transduction histidine kinase
VSDAERRLAELESRLRSIQEIALALSSTLDLDELLARIMSEVTRLMGAERSTLFVCDDVRRELWSKVAQASEVQEIRLRYGEGIAGHVAETGDTLNIPDAYADGRFQRHWDERTGFRTRSLLAMPVRNNRGKIIGVIQVLNRKEAVFGPEDEALLAALASQVAVSLENAKLYQAVVANQRALERKMFELEFLFHAEEELGRGAELEALIARTVEALSAEAGSILMTAERGDDLIFQWAVGPKSESLKRFRLPSGQGIAGWVAREGRAVMTNDPGHDPRHKWPIAEALSFPARSILCVPLFVDDRPAGAFELINKRGGDFTEDDLKLLTLTAGLVSRRVQEARHRAVQERASRLADLGQLLSGILHDLRTPMTVISGFAQLLAQDRPAAQREQYAEAILKQLEHVSTMTREILSFARGESTILLRKVYLHQLMREVEELLRPEIEGRGIELKVDVRYGGAARLDEGKVRRAIHNIARNALEAMPAGGTFALTVDREGEWLVLSFADSGPGIPEEIQDRLFQSFVTVGKPGGTGLGLAIVKKIVDEHQGQISFETAPGKGTTFRVRLPVGE